MSLPYEKIKSKFNYLAQNDITKGQFVALLAAQDYQSEYGRSFKNEIVQAVQGRGFSKSYAYQVVGELVDKGVLEEYGVKLTLPDGDYAHAKKIRNYLGKLNNDNKQSDEGAKQSSSTPGMAFWDCISTFATYYV